MSNPILFGEGTYGCAFRPAIPCATASNTNIRNKISKVLTTSAAEDEYAEYAKIAKADPKKKFYLGSPSRQFTMVPLSNLSLVENLDDSNYDYILDINPGDLLYIPCYWWHKVTTLEDESININFNFYVKDHKLSERQKNIFALHRLSGSSWWHKDPIHNFANLDTTSFFTMMCLLIKEGFSILLLALFLGYYSSNFGLVGIITSLIILILIKESPQLEFLAFGYFTTIMYFVIPTFIFGSLIGINRYKLLKQYL